jgi:hypothetical protein
MEQERVEIDKISGIIEAQVNFKQLFKSLSG